MGENGGSRGDQWDLQELISNTETVAGSQFQLPVSLVLQIFWRSIYLTLPWTTWVAGQIAQRPKTNAVGWRFGTQVSTATIDLWIVELHICVSVGEQAIGNMVLENFGMPMEEGWRLARQEFDDEEGYGVFRLAV